MRIAYLIWADDPTKAFAALQNAVSGRNARGKGRSRSLLDSQIIFRNVALLKSKWMPYNATWQSRSSSLPMSSTLTSSTWIV